MVNFLKILTAAPVLFVLFVVFLVVSFFSPRAEIMIDRLASRIYEWAVK